MKNRTKAAICSTVSVLTLSVMSSSTVMAAESSRCGGKNVAVANVSSELLIRASADDSSAVIGYVPSAGGVMVKSMDADWTKVEVGNKTGYVRTEYLAFDDKADELKSVYGVHGAVASWDDVKIFSDHEDTSSIIGTMNEGEGYEVLGSTNDWVEIQLDNGETAYVAAEDVETTMVVDGAVSVDDGTAQTTTTTYTESVQNNTYTEQTADATVPDTYTADTEYYAPETEYAADTEYYAPDTEYVPETEYTPETEYVAETEYIPETEYTPETEYVAETEYIPETEYVPETEYIPETEYVAETEYTPETEYVEETESTESAVSASSSDLDLLAALIYCEAGNQSMEGKIAVGQVVMNRVASSSFANTIHDVIYEGGQFTPASSGWLDSVIGSAPSDCYEAAQAALNGQGTVGGALYFNTGSGKGTQIGAHQFYQNIRQIHQNTISDTYVSGVVFFYMI